MRVNGEPYRTIWVDEDSWSIRIIDQTRLPWSWHVPRLTRMAEAAEAIATMRVRGAPLIGATAAYGLALALREDPSDWGLEEARDQLLGARPTAVNLRWGLDQITGAVTGLAPGDRAAAAYERAGELADSEVATCRRIGEEGLPLLEALGRERPGNEPVQILTHCNAGWLACVDWGTALAPVYQAHDRGLSVHVWVPETRPRNQGAALTVWELSQHGVPVTLIADNAAGHLLGRGRVDLCLVGTDRTTREGDVVNKIGTYPKALAAQANGVPFYVALPGSTVDWEVASGAEVPIEERDSREVTHISGLTERGEASELALVPAGTPAANPAFDVTPAGLVTGLVTERGICEASGSGLAELYPEQAG